MPLASVTGVLLAAGEGSRFGASNKLLLPLGGLPIIVHSLRSMLRSSLTQTLLITGWDGAALVARLGELRADPKLAIVHNPQWAEGAGTSVRVAAQTVASDSSALLFLPADMPLVSPSLIDRIARRCLETDRICFPTLDGAKGHPTAFPRRFFSALRDQGGPGGALALVRQNWEECERIELQQDERATQWDVDTQDDFRDVMAALASGVIADPADAP